MLKAKTEHFEIRFEDNTFHRKFEFEELGIEARML